MSKTKSSVKLVAKPEKINFSAKCFKTTRDATPWVYIPRSVLERALGDVVCYEVTLTRVNKTSLRVSLSKDGSGRTIQSDGRLKIPVSFMDSWLKTCSTYGSLDFTARIGGDTLTLSAS